MNSKKNIDFEKLFQVGSEIISPPLFLVAEAGINHNGNLDLAKEMIKVAAASGADAIKFQTFKAEEFCADSDQMFTYKSQGNLVTEPMLEMFKRYEFSDQEWFELSDYAREIGIIFLSTPQNLSDLQRLLPLGIPAVKIGSDDLTNLPLIRSYSEVGLPLILSTGMSNLGEIYAALEASNWFGGGKVAVLICTSLYPTPNKSAGIRRIKTLSESFPGLIVGFSDHTQSEFPAVMARTLGARIFEKHFTLDKNLPGPDHWFSLEPEQLQSFVNAIREVDSIMGNGQLLMQEGEIANKLEFQRVIVANQEIKAGEFFSSANLSTGRVKAGKGLSPALIDLVIGRNAKRNFLKNESIEI